MGLYVVSQKPAFAEMVKAALKIENVRVFMGASYLLEHLLTSSRSKSELAILDLDKMADAARFINFVKSAVPLAGVPLLAVGTEEQLLALDAAGAKADARLRAPCSAIELAAAVAGIEERRNPRE
jgi:DNA-binding response OmpR family regulator